jgi:hypothetical protein
MKFTRGEIGVVIGMFLVIITINAWFRVKAMGASEQQRQLDLAAQLADAGIDAPGYIP